MKTVFFYGLFMDPFSLREQGFNPANCRRAFLDNYRLIIGEKATLKHQADARVYGTLMDINNMELNALYSSEGVKEYVPVEVEVNELSGSKINGRTYILPLNKLSGINQKYASKLIAILKSMEFPESYIEEIDCWRST